MFQVTIWSLPSLLTALIAVSVYNRVREKKHIPGVRAIALLLAAILYWAACDLAGSLFTTILHKEIAAKLAYVGAALVPVAWFVFTITYARRQLRLRVRTLNVICLLPLTTALMAITNDYHHLLWTSTSLQQSQGYTGLVITYGPWFWVHAAYSFGLVFAGTSILGFAVVQANSRGASLSGVVAAPVIACAFSLFYLSPWNPAPWVDLTMIGFAIAGIFLDRGILRHGLLDDPPVRRERVVEQLSDGVVIIKADGHIVDSNPSARVILDLPHDHGEQVHISQVVTTLPLDHLTTKLDRAKQVTLAGRAFDVAASLLDSSDPKSDIVLVFRDVTDRRDNEHRMQKMQRELERLAHTCPLTALYNRRFFMGRLKEESERVRRHGSTLSVLLFDLDFFKRVNDNYGHETGDHVLIDIGEVTQSIKRVTDVAGRLGGEEFALLLPETDHKGALQLAERLREAIELHPFKDPSGFIINITASVGCATVTQSSKDPDNVLNLADRALYRAKDGGRNQVCYDEEAAA